MEMKEVSLEEGEESPTMASPSTLHSTNSKEPLAPNTSRSKYIIQKDKKTDRKTDKQLMASPSTLHSIGSQELLAPDTSRGKSNVANDIRPEKKTIVRLSDCQRYPMK